MSDILCPDCGHDIDQVLEINGKGECWTPTGDSEGNFCPCLLRPSDIARALLAECDAKLAAVRKVRDHWAAAEYESLREQNIIDTIVDDFTEALGGAVSHA